MTGRITVRMVTTRDDTPAGGGTREITVGSVNEIVRRLEYRGTCPTVHDVSVQAFAFDAAGDYLGTGIVDWPRGRGYRVRTDFRTPA